ncbi:bifunctional alpha/beta hydrolase/OsmC family protein [Gillisia sp. M10.2A]|uniref:Bifunctional alpha/beta hydrolase/OsmC family protein n=1 Tax=Gillisia lutea TaxID=2909668 RepID=A0ABS9EJ39_9FLAO|nr:bifunctional alpha/beta hydrolase/OsmC family protein [Gillisia lutea]MCF4101820.1 bifunctional alpha/beta hydrolase/OsmC family protein [Gillisia lutea]
MSSTKVTFTNKDSHSLHGKLELPIDQEPHNFVIFAHCFTCNKNYFAVKNISEALTSKGFGVLRFDFTGLGESDGEFEDSNFSGNVEDLLSAADFLEREYKAPTMLVGHSLGGAAVLFAAKKIKSVKAVATIGAPASVTHVQNLIEKHIEEIQSQGRASVNIGGRSFYIQKQFLDDLESKQLLDILPNTEVALLLLHSPQDTIVGIRNAEELYLAARHPKSFISLDRADHLLQQTEDSQYTGELIGSWAMRYIDKPKTVSLQSKHDVAAYLGESGFTTHIQSGEHRLIADEPISVGGNNFGPNPYEYVSAGLAACTSMTIQMYARRKGWKIHSVETHIDYSKDYASDCDHCDDTTAKIDTFKRKLVIMGDLDEKQYTRLLEIADKCPVHKTLHSPTQIITTLLKK